MGGGSDSIGSWLPPPPTKAGPWHACVCALVQVRVGDDQVVEGGVIRGGVGGLQKGKECEKRSIALTI